LRELHFWVLPNNGFDTFPTLKEHLALFYRGHPDVRVTISVGTAAALWTNLFRILKDPSSGARPHVLQIPSHWTASLAQLGLLQDLRELDPGLDLARWVPAARDHCRVAGSDQICSLPWWFELRVLYYRQDIFRRLGLDPRRLLAGWEGMREVCRVLAEKWRGSPGPVYPIANPNPRRGVSMADVAPCLWSRGGDFFARDGSRVLFQRSHALGGVSDYFDLIASGWMPLTGPNGLAPRNLFDGSCAMQISGRLPRRGKKKLVATLEAVPVPPTGGAAATLLGMQSLALLRDCGEPEWAYGLLRDLADPAAEEAYAGDIGAFPAADGVAWRPLAAAPHFREAFERSLGAARMLPNLRAMGTLEQVFERSMERLVGDVVQRAYEPERLHQEIIRASAEMDYILGLNS